MKWDEISVSSPKRCNRSRPRSESLPEPRFFINLYRWPQEFCWPSLCFGAKVGFRAPTRHRNRVLTAIYLSFSSRFRRPFSIEAALETLRPLHRNRTSPPSKSRSGKTVLPSAVSFLSTHFLQKQRPLNNR